MNTKTYIQIDGDLIVDGGLGTPGAPGANGVDGSTAPLAVAQTAHGLSVGNKIKITGNNTYAKAQANSAANAEVAGTVTIVSDVDNFKYLPVGPIITGSGYTAGVAQFLDPSTAGGTTETKPSTVGQIVKPVLLPINATEAIQLDYLGYVYADESGGGGGGGTGDVVGPGSATDNALAAFDGTSGKLIKTRTLTATDIPNLDVAKITTGQFAANRVVQNEVLIIAASDETTAITTGTAKVTFRMPFAMTLSSVRASLSTASSSGIPTFDINEGGSTILSTKLTIDASEKTSTTAATSAVISDTSLADDAEITIDFDVAGTGAKGVKIALIGVRT